MANEMENAVVETTENTEKVGFFKKHGKKIAIGGGIALAAVLAGLGIKALVNKRNSGECGSEDYNTESYDESDE